MTARLAVNRMSTPVYRDLETDDRETTLNGVRATSPAAAPRATKTIALTAWLNSTPLVNWIEGLLSRDRLLRPPNVRYPIDVIRRFGVTPQRAIRWRQKSSSFRV
jgi:hypothetical protein